MPELDFLFNEPTGAASTSEKSPTLTVVLAHGAGAPMDTPFMNVIAEGLASHGLRVARFEFPYMAQRRHGGARRPPNRMPELESCWRQAAEQLDDGPNLIFGGKSMGGRVASRIADSVSARGLVCLGYPFHPPKKPEKLRTAHLEELTTPTLIVQGTRDPFGTPDEVARYSLSPKIRLHWLEDGDHSFKPRKRSGFTHEQHLDATVAAMAAFVNTLE